MESMFNIVFDDYLEHHGIKGQKWGVRRYQNEDGSLTEEGKIRYRGLSKSVGTSLLGMNNFIGRTVFTSALTERGSAERAQMLKSLNKQAIGSGVILSLAAAGQGAMYGSAAGPGGTIIGALSGAAIGGLGTTADYALGKFLCNKMLRDNPKEPKKKKDEG